VRVGWIQATLYPQKSFDKPDSFQEIVDPEELLSCWNNLKHIIDDVVKEQVSRSRSVLEDSAKIRTIIDIYNTLHSKITVDDKVLLEEVLKTGKFSEDEAKSLIKNVKEKIEGGTAWY
jgi:hypothetical protein